MYGNPGNDVGAAGGIRMRRRLRKYGTPYGKGHRGHRGHRHNRMNYGAYGAPGMGGMGGYSGFNRGGAGVAGIGGLLALGLIGGVAIALFKRRRFIGVNTIGTTAVGRRQLVGGLNPVAVEEWEQPGFSGSYGLSQAGYVAPTSVIPPPRRKQVFNELGYATRPINRRYVLKPTLWTKVKSLAGLGRI